VGSSPADAKAYIATETQRWLDIIKKANVQID
jgi:hypothetical protein